MRAGLVLLGLALLVTPARADDWFLYKTGELRAYHADWLAICEDGGQGPCRAVQVPAEYGARLYDPRRLTVHVLRPKVYRVDIFASGLPATRRYPFLIDVDGDVDPLPFWAWRPGTWQSSRVAETIAITDAELNADLTQAMKRGQRMALVYPGQGAVAEREGFSLRGISAAIYAIEQQLRRRTN